MKTITDYNDFKAYVNYISYFYRLNERYGVIDQNDIKPIIPNYIMDYFLSDTKISPKDISSEVFEMYLYFQCKIINSKFIIDENNSTYIKDLCKYATDEFMQQGILTIGKTGSGKTLIFKALYEFLTKVFKIKIKYFKTYEIVQKFSIEGYDFIDSIYNLRDCIIFIDDLGAENLYNNYGITTNVILELIYRLYDNKVKCFATSNLDPKSLNKFYGERGYSRMKEMFLFKNLKGNDRR